MISSDEQEQILQTIEMFEVITQANPNDSQSLEILKDAYTRIGRHDDATGVTRRLADSYMITGQYSSALLEYESLLQQQPDNPELVAILEELEGKMHQTTSGHKVGMDGTALDLDFGSFGSDLLMVTGDTKRTGGNAPTISVPENDGNDGLAKFLIQNKIVPEDVVQSALDRVQRVNKHLSGEALAASLNDEIVKMRAIEMDALLCGILDRTKFAYIPLECYDVDRQVVKMIPETLTLGRLIVPFDLVSRTVMIAMANPFDALGKEAVQQLLDYNIQWHLASPDAIAKVLTDTYRLNDRNIETE